MEELAAVCRSHGVLFHTDAVQAAGKLPIDVQQLGVDFLSLSAHKLRAPKGMGPSVLKPGSPFEPHIIGGGQERGQRGGPGERSQNMVAYGKAAELALGHINDENTRVRALRDRLERGILQAFPRFRTERRRRAAAAEYDQHRFQWCRGGGDPAAARPGRHLRLERSACTTGSIEPSHVLRAHGRAVVRSKGSLRLAGGRTTRRRTWTRGLGTLRQSWRACGTPRRSRLTKQRTPFGPKAG
ncbi:MAG: hypothetical protein CM1200mP34_0910 [Verrucomicrobiales bacterium]|nr:MAG: hypothetical protein CM1200mP34_0910 [Verrucomicrobiales bacterium]